ncbi:hypothetical protein ACHAQH_009286 [Verticillium albo-atrum]
MASHEKIGFLNLPSELRVIIYEVLLSSEDLISPNAFYLRAKYTPALLRLNKTIHREASSVLYGQNCFDFSDSDPSEAESFFEQIGTTNASYIKHVMIIFPRFLHLESGNVTLEDESVDMLAHVRNACVNLSSITTSLFSTDSMELELDGLENYNIAREAIQLVDASFRAISPLRDVILELYDINPSDHIRDMMRSHAWILRTTECIEGIRDFDDDSDYHPRCYSEYDDYNDYCDDEDDDYDIDNDSDFWRRAAD